MSIKNLVKRLSKIDKGIYLTDDFEALMNRPLNEVTPESEAEFKMLLGKVVDDYEAELHEKQTY